MYITELSNKEEVEDNDVGVGGASIDEDVLDDDIVEYSVLRDDDFTAYVDEGCNGTIGRKRLLFSYSEWAEYLQSSLQKDLPNIFIMSYV